MSLLSAPKPIRFADEADLLAQIRAGEDGLILEADGRRATFLPQVWESMPDKRAFLGELMQQGGAAGGHAPRALQGFALPGVRSGRNRRAPIPAAGGTRCPTGACSATCARATASCTRASAGLCFVRKMEQGRMVLTTYGRSSGFCVDPVEKKPLNHFYPGHLDPLVRHRGLQPGVQVLPELGHLQVARDGPAAGPGDAARRSPQAALDLSCRSVAFTYNDPVIFAEYAMDIADACHAQGVKAVAVTAGYIHAEPRREFYAKMDAANVDLKGFTDDFYYKICGGRLQPVLDTLVYLVKETAVWTEITTLLIPGKNDSDEELQGAMQMDLRDNLGPDVPLHFTAFHPDWKMTDVAPTPASTLTRAREIAQLAGLNYVYTGNVHDEAGGSTYCPSCEQAVIGATGTTSAAITLWKCATRPAPAGSAARKSRGASRSSVNLSAPGAFL